MVVVSLITSSHKDAHTQNSGTCEYVMLHGREDFADVIKVTDLTDLKKKMGRIIQVRSI